MTLDIDWAPDFVIDAVAEKLMARRVRATWFVTHDSPAVRRLQDHDALLELGLHPNFLPGSSHGESVTEVLSFMRDILPDARAMRTHGLVQSTSILSEAVDSGIDIDLSLFMPHTTHLSPHFLQLKEGRNGLVRLPYFWEDDFATYEQSSRLALDTEALNRPGLKVFDFHPIHIYLNTEEMARYAALKQQGPLPKLSCGDVDKWINRSGFGTGTLFDELLDYLSTEQAATYTVSQIADAWRDSHENRNSRTYASAV